MVQLDRDTKLAKSFSVKSHLNPITKRRSMRNFQSAMQEIEISQQVSAEQYMVVTAISEKESDTVEEELVSAGGSIFFQVRKLTRFENQYETDILIKLS